MTWIAKFSAAAAALIVIALLIVWAVGGFQLGVGGHVEIAMFLGIFFTIAVSVVLMALIFYSHNTGYDSDVQKEQKGEKE
jgi:hypothetical protein